MRRRPQRLQVSTFPFLAVLLCTMGSLILVLLVIDRRAKAGARAKAILAARKVVEEDEQTAAARKAEWKRRRQALHAALAEQMSELRRQAEALRRQTGDTEASIRAAAKKAGELKERIRSEKDRLTRDEAAVGAKKAAVAELSKESEATQAQLRRLAADMNALERVLADLKAARERQMNSYSVVPYKGKYGDNRKPLYVECSGRGLVFHPDREVLDGYNLSPLDIRDVLERRLLRHNLVQAKASSKEDKPYLLMLLRPSGIENYYHTLSALVGLSVDFGYELVDEDWAFDFPEDREPPVQPWMSPRISRAVAPPEGMRRAPVAGSPGPAGVPDAPGDAAGTGGGQPGGWSVPSGVPLARRGIVTGGDGPAFDPYHPHGIGTGVPGVAGPGRSIASAPGGVFGGGPGGGGSGSGYGGPGGGPPGAGGVGPGAGAAGSVRLPSGVPLARRGMIRGGEGPPFDPYRPPVYLGGLHGFGPGGGGAAPAAGAGRMIAQALVGSSGGGNGSGPGGIPGGSGGALGGVPGVQGGVPGAQPGGRYAGPGGVAGGGGMVRGPGGLPGGVGTFPQGEGSGAGATDGLALGAAGPAGQPRPLGPGGGPGGGSGVQLGSPTAGGGPGGGNPGGGGSTPGTSPPDPAMANAGSPPAGSPPAGGGSPAQGQGGVGIPSIQIGPGAKNNKQGGGGFAEAAPGADPAGPGTPPARDVPFEQQPFARSTPGGAGPGGGSPAPPGTPPDPFSRLRAPLPTAEKPPPGPPPRPTRMVGNRDLIIPIECNGEGVTVPAGGSRQIPVATLQRNEGAAALQQAVRDIIQRRQSTTRANEAPYQPQVRFLVRPDGLRAYYLAFPALEPLKVPMTRANVAADSDRER